MDTKDISELKRARVQRVKMAAHTELFLSEVAKEKE